MIVLTLILGVSIFSSCSKEECETCTYTFAWVDVAVTRTNSQLAKALESVGFRKSHRAKTMTLWDPAQHRGQSMDCKEQGAYAYADTLRAHGINASAGSRAD